MNITVISAQTLPTVRTSIIQFMQKYGDGRITHRALRWFQQLRPEQLTSGTLVAMALDHKQVAGVIVFGNYGIDEAFVAVHPDYRQQKVGESLLNHALQHFPKLYTRVACDNIPSLKLCFSCGLVAFQLFKGPTGKPTLWLSGGNWNAEDIASTRKNSSSE